MTGLLGISTIFMLTACGAASSAPSKATGSQAVSPSPSPTPEPTPTPTPDLDAIGVSYLALVDPLNAATCAFNTVLGDTGATLDQLKQGAADYATSLRTFADGMRAIAWPPAIDADARELIKADAAVEAGAQEAAAASTTAAFDDAFATINAANTEAAAAANLVRGDLGLPSVSGNSC